MHTHISDLGERERERTRELCVLLAKEWNWRNLTETSEIWKSDFNTGHKIFSFPILSQTIPGRNAPHFCFDIPGMRWWCSDLMPSCHTTCLYLIQRKKTVCSFCYSRISAVWTARMLDVKGRCEWLIKYLAVKFQFFFLSVIFKILFPAPWIQRRADLWVQCQPALHNEFQDRI